MTPFNRRGAGSAAASTHFPTLYDTTGVDTTDEKTQTDTKSSGRAGSVGPLKGTAGVSAPILEDIGDAAEDGAFPFSSWTDIGQDATCQAREGE